MFFSSFVEPSNLEQAVAKNPLIVTPDTLVTDAISLMSHGRGNCVLQDIRPDLGYLLTDVLTSCVLVMEGNQLLGIFTERDVVRLSANGRQIAGETIANVMTRSVVTLRKSEFTDIFAVLNLFQHHGIRHLPITDDNGRAIGLLTHDSLSQLLRSADLLRLRLVSEVMVTQVVHASPEASVLEIAQLMAAQNVSTVAIAEQRSQGATNNSLLFPIGIVTERDIVQCQALELDIKRIQGREVMSTPVFSIRPDDSLMSALLLMQQRQIRWVAVTTTQGNLVGIVTQGTLLQTLSPVELYKRVEILEQKLCQLEAEKRELLQNHNRSLEQQVRERVAELQAQAERERLLNVIASRIRSSLNLQDTLNTIVTEVRQFLECDRVYVYQLHSDLSGIIVAESTARECDSVLGRVIHDSCIVSSWLTTYINGNIRVVPDVYAVSMSPCHLAMLEKLQIRAKILVPIIQGETLWGMLSAIEVYKPRDWQSEEVNLLQQISTQASIAIAQAKAYERAQAELVERQRIENALRQSEHRYASLAEAAPVGIFRTDMEGHCLYVNERWCQIAGLTPADAMGMGWVKALHPDDREPIVAEWNRSVKELTPFRLEYRFQRPDGKMTWVFGQAVAERGANGEIEGYIGTITDISERKEAMEALRQLNQELEARVEQRTTALRESEERWHLALRGSNDGIWDWNVRTNKVFFSTRWKEMRGFGEHEIGDAVEEWSSRIHPDDYNRVLTAVADHFARKTPFFQQEYRVKRKDGSYMWILDKGQALWDEAGNVIRMAGSESDITEHKQTEEQLCNLSDRLTVALRSGAIGIWEWDTIDDILIWDDRMYDLYGIHSSQFAGAYQAWANGVHPEDRPQAEAAIQKALQGQKEFDTEFRILHPDGTIRFVKANGLIQRDERGQPLRMIGINFDISDRKLAEETLKQQLTTIEAVIDGIAILEGDTYTYVNKAHLELFGYDSPEELIGKTWRTLYSPEEINRFEQEVFPILMQQHFWQGEATATQKDGTTFAEGLSLTMTESGKLICVCRDITEQKQAEEELQQMNERLALTNAELHRATRLKDEFLANMSHELRTPLNAILGMSEGFQEEVYGHLNARQKQAIAAIERSGKHLLELINDILDLSKIESGKLELQTDSVAVSYLCESSLTFVRQQAIQKNLQLSTELPSGLPNIVVDERRIRQVLINLLNNAVKFTPSGGRVELLVQLQQQPKAGFLCLSVVDTGIGIAQENMNKLFQPFIQIDSSLNRQYSGTGLGLALVEQLVKLHQGTVEVTSEVGRGSCFTVRLPYVNQPQLFTPTLAEPTTLSILASEKSQVLIIEDSLAAAEQTVRYLSELNMQATIYSKGEGAIDEALRIQPSLIILDILLPKLSGWEVLKQLKAHPQTLNIPTLVISVVDERSQALVLGATEYLVKPITREKFCNVLEKIQHPEKSKTTLIIPPPVASIKNTSPPLILLAEDNEANTVTISSYLETRGYRLILATNGQEAVTLSKAEHPNLIIMDIQMPGMDGLEAMRQIRADLQLNHTPIIAVTALAMPGDRENCITAGANDYLTKPVKLKLLLEKIQYLLNQKSS
ncbi:PAS domain-containing protein [Scytonema sp. UIC 10036]|uniref:PAS domain-containing protein n=1 Tax=Scytonema sp. UIC 10036 TaxID=2304196 RepID=UPI0012DAD0FF|nr:PAS domain-containing protein [Scytonema sp. UIC 10036]MUG99886.1 PAS domain-containing protein [Scytonema sp. UIC 10036]